MSIEEKRLKYEQLLHAMQTGVAFVMEIDEGETSPKHLRVGVNSAMIDSGAMAGLLIKKGIITEDEYYDALIEVAEREVQSYKAILAKLYPGGKFELY